MRRITRGRARRVVRSTRRTRSHRKCRSSEHCLEANKWAMQVLGGYGYTRDYPLERLYRDNRLNHIHEGTFGIQGIDLLGRKVGGDKGRTMRRFIALMRETGAAASRIEHLSEDAARMAECLDALSETTDALLGCGDPAVRLANATVYLDAFGHDRAVQHTDRRRPSPRHIPGGAQ